MGLMQRDKAIYINVANGYFVTGSKENKEKFEEFYGRLEDIYLKDHDYEGTVTLKAHLIMRDDETSKKYDIAFTFDSVFSRGFFARITMVDIRIPFTIGTSEGERQKITTCYIRQNGLLLKKDPAFPQAEKVDGKWMDGTVIRHMHDLVKQISTDAKAPRSAKDEAEDDLNRFSEDFPRDIDTKTGEIKQ